MSTALQGWSGRRVLLTGHTGFKGSWLSIWLKELGALVYGYALAPETTPSMFAAAGVDGLLAGHRESDVRDIDALKEAVAEAAPDVVFHLAAQSLVRRSYDKPTETWSTNVMGTVNVLDILRHCPSVRAVVVVTTDKCYAPKEWPWGYRENDALGGHDPYSASKAAAELVVDSYRKAFFRSRPSCLLASARAGNVIGGGDWSDDRLLPDVARAYFAQAPLTIRAPHSVRPWQHVLESLHGYLLLAQQLMAGDTRCAEAWNFGPAGEDSVPVLSVVQQVQKSWPELQIRLETVAQDRHESNFLYLDATRARRLLQWRPIWNLPVALNKTTQWYEDVHKDSRLALQVTRQQIADFTADASRL